MVIEQEPTVPQSEKEKSTLVGLLNQHRELKKEQAGKLRQMIEMNKGKAISQLPPEVVRDYNQTFADIAAVEQQIQKGASESGWSVWKNNGSFIVARLSRIPKGEEMVTFRVEDVISGYDGLKPGATFVNTNLETAPLWAIDAIKQGAFVGHGSRTIKKGGETFEISIPDGVYAQIPETESESI